MRALLLASLLVAASVSSGCLVLTLQPIYDDTSLDVDETLAGAWQGQEQVSLVVERGEWKSYRLTYTARSTSYALVGYLTKIGEATFLDLTPAHGLEAGPLMIPAHGVCRLQHEGDTITILPLDYDYFTALVRAKTLAKLDTAFDGKQNLLLTSKTAVVRAWLLGHLKAADAFREPVSFTRVK